MSNRYLQHYDGYLKQHLGLIEDMHQAGADNITIAVQLYDLGARANLLHDDYDDYDIHIRDLAALVGYIRRKWFGWKKRPALHFWADP